MKRSFGLVASLVAFTGALVTACNTNSDGDAAASVEEFCAFVGENGDPADFGPGADPEKVAGVYAEIRRLAPTSDVEQSMDVIASTMAEYYELEASAGADAAYAVLLDPDYGDATVTFLTYLGDECFAGSDTDGSGSDGAPEADPERPLNAGDLLDHVRSTVPGTDFIAGGYERAGATTIVEVTVNPATADAVAACEAVLVFHSDAPEAKTYVARIIDDDGNVLARGEVGGTCTAL